MPRRSKKEKIEPCLHSCEWKDCHEPAPHHAPKIKHFSDRPLRESELHWFCPLHIREYNRQWDFFSGMNQKEIEAYYKEAVTGHRPTSKWDLRADLNSIWQWHKQVNFLGEKYQQDRAAFKEKIKPALPKHLKEAAEILGIDLPSPLKLIKKRYKLLVKQHHPDVNKGCKASEEKFKAINQAYHTLLDCDFVTN